MAEADGGATSSDFSYHEGQKREDVWELTALLVVYDYVVVFIYLGLEVEEGGVDFWNWSSDVSLSNNMSVWIYLAV